MSKRVIKLIDASERYETIFHCADIHIRNWKRHTEYNAVFEKLYAELEKDTSKKIIVVAGDIAHSKTDISPELVIMIHSFLTKLAKYGPVVVIPGNHDANLNNPNRIDVISSVIDIAECDNIFYLKKSGLYRMGNVVFSSMSILEDPEKYIRAEHITDKNTIKIALFHGALNNARLDSGLSLITDTRLSLFDGFDLALLGDIHKFQYLNSDKTIAYSSSLIQQGFGESYDYHGILKWNLNDLTSTFINIPNEYAFVTLNVKNNVLIDDIKLNKTHHVRLKGIDSSIQSLKQIAKQLERKYKINDIVILNGTTGINGTNTFKLPKVDVNLRDIHVQNKLIDEYLINNTTAREEERKAVQDLNGKLNQQLVEKDLVRDSKFAIKKFEFSNFLSYGVGNVIDFTDVKGVVGLFGQNASGKSALLDALTFILFDQADRSTRADQLLNNKSNFFEGTVNFELNGVEYYIHKRGIKQKGYHEGKVKVNVNFWKIGPDGSEISLNGRDRKETVKIIKSYIGTFEEFVMTNLSLQNNNANFIALRQADRKDLLSKFLDLQIYDELKTIADKAHHALEVLIENDEESDYDTKISNDKARLKQFKAELTKVKSQYTSTQQTLTKLNNQLNKLILVRDGKKQSIEQLKWLHSEKKSLENELLVISKQLNASETYLNKLPYDKAKDIHILTPAEFDKLTHKKQQTLPSKVGKFRIDISKLLTDCTTLQATLDNVNSKLEKLNDLEYDENCTYCMNNIFVQDAIKSRSLQENLVSDIAAAKAQLQAKQAESEMYEIELREVQQKCELHNIQKAQQQTYQLKLDEINGHKQRIDFIKSSIKSMDDQVQKLESDIKSVDVAQIDSLTTSITQLTKEHKSTSESMSTLQNAITALETAIEISHQQNETLKNRKSVV